MEIKEKVKSFDLTSLLGYPDSNQERQDQNLQCYHYTISQTFIELVPNSNAKVIALFETAKFMRNFLAL